jgi:hypothetical protein
MRIPVFRQMCVGVAALAVGFLLAGTGIALAFESQLPEKEPLRITKFTMEPTRATHLSRA